MAVFDPIMVNIDVYSVRWDWTAQWRAAGVVHIWRKQSRQNIKIAYMY